MRLRFLVLLFVLMLPYFGMAQAGTDQQLGLQFYNDKEYQKAAEVFERLYKNKPDHFSYTYYLQSLLELGQGDDAIKLVRQQIRKNQDDPKYQVDEGYVLIRSNQTQKALKLYDELVKDLKPDQRYVLNLANAFISRREYDYAIKTYQKGRQLLAPDQTFGFELAMLYELQGQYDKMVDEYLGILDRDPVNSDQVQSRLQSSLNNDPENRKTEALRKGLTMQVQKNPDNVTLTEMLVWLSLQLKDFESALIQAKALDRRLGENGGRVYALGQLSSSNGNYAVAKAAFTYVMEKSNDPSMRTIAEVELLRSEYDLLSSSYPEDENKLAELADKYRTAISKSEGNPLVFPLVRNLAHIEGFHLHHSDIAIELLQNLITKTQSDRMLQAQCKLDLADIYLFSGEPWEATLLYSQVDKAFKNDPIGHEARFRNAKLSFYIGEFDWARAQLDVLKAATSKLIANDAMQMSLLISDNIDADSSTVALGSYARADLLLFRNETDQAYKLLDSILLAFPGHSITDEVLMKKAEIKLKQGDFVTADTLYKEIVAQYPFDILADDALFNLGKLYQFQLKDKDKAMKAYQQLMSDFPGSLYVVEARKQFRTLRGDFQGDEAKEGAPDERLFNEMPPN